MRFGYTIIYVPNLKEAIKFYEDAFGLKTKFVAETGFYAELDTGATTLSFCTEDRAQGEITDIQPTRPSALPPAIEIAFVTDDVEASFKKAVEAGAQPIQKPGQKPWGQCVSYVRDLNGVLVEICSAM